MPLARSNQEDWSKGNLQACLDRIKWGIEFRSAVMGELPLPNVPYAQPLLDAVGLFERLKIGYALIGGVAVMYYGRPRFTEDLDFVAMTGHADLLAANPQAMREFHFDSSCTFKLYHDSGVGVAIWKDEPVDGIVARSIEAELAGRPVRIADPHDLIAMKLRSRRIRDDSDI